MSDYDELHMRRFVAARRAGDEDGMVEHWSKLVTGNFDRVVGFVGAEAHKRRLADADRDDALSDCLTEMLTNLRGTFRGESVGEFVKATRTLVGFRCTTMQEKVIERRRRSASYEAAPGEDDDAPSAYERGLRRIAGEDESIAAAEEDDRELHALGAAFLDWALPQLGGKRREVLELERQGVPDAEIAKRLDCSLDVVYQSRRRGRQDLDGLRDRYEES